MYIGRFKTGAFALALVLGIGALAQSTVQAQYPNGCNRNYGYGSYPHGGPYNRSYGYYGPYTNGGYYGPYANGGYYGPYGNRGYGGYYGGGYGSDSVAHGYRDGFNRGGEDARDGRYPTPNNSEHFRNGNPAYRAGFARGYQAGFGQYAGGYGGYGGYGSYGGYRPF